LPDDSGSSRANGQTVNDWLPQRPNPAQIAGQKFPRDLPWAGATDTEISQAIDFAAFRELARFLQC
jgi:hypothetical protein